MCVSPKQDRASAVSPSGDHDATLEWWAELEGRGKEKGLDQ